MKKILTVAITLLTASASVALPPAEFVKKAGASDLYEITSSKLVVGSTNPKLKSFATMMVTDHTNSTAQVKAAARQSDVKPMPPKLEPKQAADIAALKKARGEARDALYVTQQKAAHQEALALHTENASDSPAPALKAVSATIVPIVQHHIEQLSQM